MVSRGQRRDRESRRARITIGRRARKIGFLGKGVTPPSRGKSDVAHALSLRIDESLIAVRDRERERCRVDALPRPATLQRVFSRKPAVVVFPDSAQCVADILDVCIEEKTPAVPRGSGSAGLGGSIPVRGGVVIDLSKMTRIVSLEGNPPMVTVEPGCTWQGLRNRVESEGLSLASYPTNTSGGTVGGWLSCGGYGVGTLAHGPFHSSLEALEVAVPSGLLVSAGHGEGRYSIESLAGTEGQLGIVTSLTFPLKRKPESIAHFGMAAGRLGEGVQILRKIASMDPPPLGARLMSGGSRFFPAEIGGGMSGNCVVAVLFEGAERALAAFETYLKATVRALGAELGGSEQARSIFETQVTDSAGHADRTLVRSGEVLIGLDRLSDFMGILKRAAGEEIFLDVQVVGRDLALVMAFGLAGGSDLRPVVRDVPMTFNVSQLALKFGGRPYGIGIWNTPHAGRAIGRSYGALKAIKNETDRLMILNPGKFFTLTTGSGLPVWGWMYKAGMSMIRRFS